MHADCIVINTDHSLTQKVSSPLEKDLAAPFFLLLQESERISKQIKTILSCSQSRILKTVTFREQKKNRMAGLNTLSTSGGSDQTYHIWRLSETSPNFLSSCQLKLQLSKTANKSPLCKSNLKCTALLDLERTVFLWQTHQ